MTGSTSAAPGPGRSPAWRLVGRQLELDRIAAARAAGQAASNGVTAAAAARVP